MKKNMGTADKGIRFLLACILVVIYFAANFENKIIGISLLVLALILALTSFISFCPLYTLLGINTYSTKKAPHAPPSNLPNQHHHPHHHHKRK